MALYPKVKDEVRFPTEVGNQTRMISVIVCTHNRSQSLRKTLRSLAEMAVPLELSWEIIVVDNNSTDDTRQVVEEFAGTSRLNVQYLFEGKTGLSFARNNGVTVSRGEIVAFTDDDCIVDTHWIASAAKEFSSDVSVSVISGRVELYDKDDLLTAVRTYKDRAIISSLGQLVGFTIGCNMFFTRRVFNEVGEFDTTFGAGTKIASGEDTDFLYRAYKQGFKIVYSPEVLLYHNHGRKTEAHAQASSRGYALGRGGFYCKHIGKDVEVLKLACTDIVLTVLSRLRDLLPGRSTKTRRPLFALVLGAIYRLQS